MVVQELSKVVGDERAMNPVFDARISVTLILFLIFVTVM